MEARTATKNLGRPSALPNRQSFRPPRAATSCAGAPARAPFRRLLGSEQREGRCCCHRLTQPMPQQRSAAGSGEGERSNSSSTRTTRTKSTSSGSGGGEMPRPSESPWAFSSPPSLSPLRHGWARHARAWSSASRESKSKGRFLKRARKKESWTKQSACVFFFLLVETSTSTLFLSFFPFFLLMFLFACYLYVRVGGGGRVSLYSLSLRVLLYPRKHALN